MGDKLLIGAVVRLKGGGPMLTVETVAKDGKSVGVVWFDQHPSFQGPCGPHRAELKTDILDEIPPGSPVRDRY